MKTKIILPVIFLSTLFFSNHSFSQDSSKAGEGWKWEWDDAEEFTNWESKSPTISLIYGFSDLYRNDVTSSFAKNNLAELRLGYTSLQTSKYSDMLNKIKYTCLIITHNSTSLAGGSDNGDNITTRNWRFGFLHSDGYSYKIGSGASIGFYYGGSLNWTNINFKTIPLNPDDIDIFNRYDETFRFGSSYESGLRVQLSDIINIEGSYERSIVFERHLFWKWAGSAIMEAVSQGLLDKFIGEILKASPAAGPIVYVVLKSALGYGLYELRKDKMNWPFNSAAPIGFDNFKFGVTFTF